ncbi:MAG: endonuclease/exonuclease/phosphatase family protein [Verrucomicrobia bacterium]|nr:endonuclease/exonuclease/phosphatase family protein [Verrucomicrobiota bacterium]
MNTTYVVSYDRWIPRNLSDVSTFARSLSFLTASYLTDPTCKAKEYFVRSLVLDDLPSASPRIRDFLHSVSYLPFCSFLAQDEYAKWAEFYYLRVAAAGFAVLSPITTPVGIALRAIVGNVASGPLHYRGSLPEKEREGNQFSHLLRNICGIKAGYDIEEGAQMPLRDDLNYRGSDRVDRLIAQIEESDPDVLCLNEVFDIRDAHYIANALKNRYAHFIFQCGPRSIGTNSGLFFATKFSVSDIQFKAFPKEMLVDTAKYCEKGVLLVDVKDSKGEIATIALTHAQHSDQVRHGSRQEKKARTDELEFIMESLARKTSVVLTGDINMDDDEMKEPDNIAIYNQFVKNTTYIDERGKEHFTWGGDKWYVDFGNRTTDSSLLPAAQRLEPRKPSTGCNLDHTMVTKSEMTITSTLIKDPVAYDPTKISRDSLSDHRGLWSIITLPK